MHQGSPRQVAEMLLQGEADIGVATEVLASYPDVVALPCYRWTHAVLAPRGHPLAQDHASGAPLTLERLVQFPIVTYEAGYTGRSHIDAALDRAGLRANVYDFIQTFAPPLTREVVQQAS